MDTIAATAEHVHISTMAKLYGVSLRTLRFYEDLEMLAPSREGTTRLYSRRDRMRLELILKGKKLGLSLREIERLIREAGSTYPGPDEAKSGLLLSRMDRMQLEQQLARMHERRAAIELSIAELETALGCPADQGAEQGKAVGS